MQVMWPFLVKHRDPRPWLTGQSQESRRSLSGAATIVPVFFGHWMMDLAVLIEGRDGLLQFEAFLACMEGRNGTTLVPVHSWVRPQDRDGHDVVQNMTAPLAESGTFEHWGFDAASTIACTVTLAAAQRATRLRFTLGNTTGLRPGHYFSVGDHLYQAQLVWANDDGTHTVQFQPPLRAAVALGAAMVLDRVHCRMRLRDERVNLDRRQPFVQTLQLGFEEVI